VDIPLVAHILNVNPLMLDHWNSLRIKHRVVLVLVKENPKSLIRAPLLAIAVAWPISEGDNVPQILLVVVDLFPVGVNYWGLDLQALKLVRRLRSATTRRDRPRGRTPLKKC
jgi:hypothetical protein